MSNFTRCKRDTARRGTALVLVMIVIAMALIIGLTFLAAATTTTGVAQTMDHHAHARQIAESGVGLALGYIQQTPDWRAVRTSGPWFTHDLYGGAVELAGVFDAEPEAAPIVVNDQSFETTVDSLDTPLLDPPMSGAIGGWVVERTAAIETGATVPLVGVMDSPTAPDGDRVAYVFFLLNIEGSASFSQTLSEPLAPNTNYALTVNVGRALLASVLADVELHVYAGSTLIVSSTNPSIFSAFNESGDPSVFTTISLGSLSDEQVVRFTTDDAPPAGLIRIELTANSRLGVASQVLFDDVRMEVETYTPITLTAIGRLDDESHQVTATIAQPYPGHDATIMKWSEP